MYVCGTGMAGSTLLLTLGWIVFTEVSSSSRSGSGSAAGIFWCSGIILYVSKAMTRLGQCELKTSSVTVFPWFGHPTRLEVPEQQRL